MPVPSRIYDLSGTANSNSPAGADSVGTSLDDYLRAIQAVLRGDLASKGADIASATTTDLGAVQGLFHDITGTTTITGFGTVAAGVWKVLKFEGALTLTHNATSLILLSGANRATVAGDVGIFASEGSGNWREVAYMPVGVNFARPAADTITALITGLERARWTAQGFFKATNTQDYNGATGTYHEVRSNTEGSIVQVMSHAHASGPYGQYIVYTAGDPNGTSNEFLQCYGQANLRAAIRSNGGLSNYSANNVNLSTRESKYGLSVYSDGKLKLYEQLLEKIDWGIWKYKDQSHDDFNHGPTAEGVRDACLDLGLDDESRSLVDQFSPGQLGLVPEDLKNLAIASLVSSNKRLRARVDDIERRLDAFETK